MNCTDFELETQRWLDERGDALPAAMRDHAARCPACLEFWQAQQTLLAATRSWTRITAPASLAQSVLTALAQSESVDSRRTQPLAISTSPQRVSRGSAWAALCATAALMLLAVMMIRLSPPTEPTVSGDSVARISPAGKPEDALVSQTLAGLWQGVHTEYREFSQETTRVLDGLGELPESAALLPSLPAQEFTPSEKPSPSWLRLARPVSDRVGQAFDFLRDAVPGETPQSS